MKERFEPLRLHLSAGAFTGCFGLAGEAFGAGVVGAETAVADLAAEFALGLGFGRDFGWMSGHFLLLKLVRQFFLFLIPIRRFGVLNRLFEP